MKKRFGNIAKTIKIARKQNVTLRARMMLYLVSMLLAAVGITVLVFVGYGMFWNEEDRLSWELNNHLDRVCDEVTSDMDEYEGYAYNLSQVNNQYHKEIQKYPVHFHLHILHT